MSNRQPQNRRNRRQPTPGQLRLDQSRLDLPGPLRFLTHPKLFIAVGLVMAGAILLSLFAGALFSGNTTTSSNEVGKSANEVPDVPRDTPSADSTAAPSNTPAASVKHYTAPPPMVIDPSKRYTATIKTDKGDIQLELDPSQAPDAVNAFVFLAQDGYYNGTPFMQVTKNPDGSRFTAQAGDPTETGLGTPGFDVPAKATDEPFTRGAVGIAQGQFFISYGDYPALNGKYTIIGKVVSGLDVLDKLSLLDVSKGGAGASGDDIQSVSITPN